VEPARDFSRANFPAATQHPRMRWYIFAIGKPKLGYARTGIEEYAARLKPFVPVTIEYLKGSSMPVESLALMERSKGMYRVVLDERGETLTSRAFAKKLGSWQLHGPRDFALLVGGADGHTEELRQAADWRWSLSPLTLQHELALLVVIEQLYRACTIQAGMPYHRD
jgi:23S rRNA (pseudouridine1915-N3)-methyltransferase